MGSDYSGDKPPQLLVWALKDPIGPNLDRIQIIKGWLEDGEMKDTVYNVVASGDRLKEDGTVEPIDAPIDLQYYATNTDLKVGPSGRPAILYRKNPLKVATMK